MYVANQVIARILFSSVSPKIRQHISYNIMHMLSCDARGTLILSTIDESFQIWTRNQDNRNIMRPMHIILGVQSSAVMAAHKTCDVLYIIICLTVTHMRRMAYVVHNVSPGALSDK